jgi:hypothetical protein
VKSFIVAEDDMVVQFSTRELIWPGGAFLGFEAPAGTAIPDMAFPYRLVEGCIAERWAIGDDLTMLRKPRRAAPMTGSLKQALANSPVTGHLARSGSTVVKWDPPNGSCGYSRLRRDHGG